MPRSDGKFPSYTKLRIDPELWPDKYWEESRRCVGCAKQWPNTHLFETCLDCKQKTVGIKGSPHMRWPDAVQSLLHTRFEMLYSIWNEGVEDEQLGWEDIKTNGKVDGTKIKQAVDDLIRPIQKQT